MMNVIKRFKNAKNFDEFDILRNNFDNEKQKIFDFFCLYHSAETEFQKHLAKKYYTPEYMIEMNDVETLKNNLPLMLDITNNISTVDDEMFNFLIKNLNNFFIDYEVLVYIKKISISRFYKILNSDLMKILHKEKWFENLAHQSIRDLNIEFLNILIENGYELHPSILIIEIMNENTDRLEKLISFFDLNKKYEYAFKFYYPLEFAIDNNNVHIIKMLLKYGADANKILKNKKIKNKTIQYLIDKACNRLFTISRKLPDNAECPVMMEKVKLYHLCLLSDKHFVSIEGFTEFCPLCRVGKLDINTIYENN